MDKASLQQVANYMRVLEPAKTKLFDPCCRTGQELSDLGDAMGVDRRQLFGNEKKEHRFKHTESLEINAVCGDFAFELTSNLGAFSLMHMRAPFDDTWSLDGKNEMQQLNQAVRFLTRYGVLLYVAPKKALVKPEFAEFMPLLLKFIKVFSLPAGPENPEDLHIVVGMKDRGQDAEEEASYYKQLTSPTVLGEEIENQFIVPAAPDYGNFHFYSKNLTKTHFETLKARPALQGRLEYGLIERVERKVHSLMPLRAGHMALMLSSGMMDGAYKDPESGNLIVVSGKTFSKVDTQEWEEEDHEVRVKITRPSGRIQALDMDVTKQEGELQLVTYE